MPRFVVQSTNYPEPNVNKLSQSAVGMGQEPNENDIVGVEEFRKQSDQGSD